MTKPAATLALLGALSVLGVSAQEALTPRVVTLQRPSSDLVIALQIIAPVAGETDATARLQAAVDRVGAAGGGTVFVAVGTYPLRQPLVLREGVTVRGEWAPPDRGVSGSILAVYDRPERAEGPAAITLERGSGLREMAVWYPEQNPEAVVAMPWTLGTSEKVNGDNVTVMNVTLVNAYRGIRIGPEWNELQTLRHVYITPLEAGIYIDTTTDIGRLNQVVLSPRIWEQSGLPGAPLAAAARAALRRRLAESVVGLDIGRSDWEYIVGVEAEGLSTGVRFRPGREGTTNAVMLNCSFRACGTALQLDRLNGVGLAATACEFVGSRQAVQALASFDTVAQFNTCTLTGPTAAVTLAGKGLLSFQNCQLRGLVDAAAGQLSLVDCQLGQAATHVSLGAGVTRARLLGCRFDGEPVIRQQAVDADVVISQRPTDSARFDGQPHRPAPARGPRTAALVVVTDHGASPDLPDNTAAFSAALEAARQAAGATVYVPAGNYRFAGTLTVPAGCELRGSFDVPHHTVSAGSVLMPLGGRKSEDGTPFLRLEAGSGLRGLTVWYPEQNVAAPVAYPWTVRALGPACWLEDVTLGNAWQGVDFWTHPSDGHVIRYLAGACLRRGLWVSKCDTEGWVEDLQFNPHYALRLHPSLPRPPEVAGQSLESLVDFQRKQLEAMVFGRCHQEHIFATFLYAAYDGIAFRDDQGGSQARVLIHGTDTASRALVLEKVGAGGVDFANAQLVPLGKWAQAAIVATPNFSGTVRLFNSQCWAGPATAQLAGQGDVLLQQMNTLSGPVTLQGGSLRLENVVFGQDLTPHVKIGPKAAAADLLGCLGTYGLFRWDAGRAGRVRALGNAASLRPRRSAGGTPAPPSRTWAEMRPVENTIATPGGGQRGVTAAACVVQTGADPAPGKRVVRFSGRIADPAYAYCYFRLVDGPFAILPDTVLSCRIKPLTEAGVRTSIDAACSAGAPLRDRGLHTRDGVAVHPSGATGKVGEWRTLEIPLGTLAGETLDFLMVGFDARGVEGDFAALVDAVSITSDLGTDEWRVTATPAGGAVAAGTRVALASASARVRYTLDGSNPSPASALYAAPIALPADRASELRFAAESAAGRLCPIVFSAVFDVP